MSDYDPRIAGVLDRLLPSLTRQGNDWDGLLREVGELSERRADWAVRVPFSSRGKAMAVLAAALAVTALVSLPALAISNGWWFLHSGAPRPVDHVAVVASGRSAGTTWTMTAYLSKDRGVCVGLNPHLRERDMGAESCGSGIRGEPNRARSGFHWVGYIYFALGLFDFPDFVFGPAAVGVEDVELVLSDGQTIRTATIEGPDELEAPVAFYVVELPPSVVVDSIVARDGSGTVLERRDCLGCFVPGSSSAP